MKRLKRIALLLVLTIGVGLVNSNAKSLKRMENRQVDMSKFNLAQFGKYLQDGHPHAVEGVYMTKDGRYSLAIVRNQDSTHDFIAIVLEADNKFWNSGDVKFNFIQNDSTELEGLYYNSAGEASPIDFEISENGLISDYLIKVDPLLLRIQGLAKL